MKLRFILVAMGVIMSAGGCQHPGHAVQAPKVSTVPHYLMVGKVKKPGMIPCSEITTATLSGLINKAGGFTDYSLLKNIRVIHEGVTNKYNYRLIKEQKAE